MIPNHVLNNLGTDDRVAVLTRRGELYFLVHGADEPADAITARADRDGCKVLATHMRDETAILELVADREPDVGGEGNRAGGRQPGSRALSFPGTTGRRVGRSSAGDQ